MTAVHALPAAALVASLLPGQHRPVAWWCAPQLPARVAGWDRGPDGVWLRPTLCRDAAVAARAYQRPGGLVDAVAVADAVAVVAHEQAHADGEPRECRCWAAARAEAPPVLRRLLYGPALATGLAELRRFPQGCPP